MRLAGGISVAALVVSAVCGAQCQAHDLKAAGSSLPDAPAAQTTIWANRLASFLPAADFSANGRTGFYKVISSGMYGNGSAWRDWVAAYKEPRDTNEFFRKQLPALLRHNASYNSATNGSLMRRAIYAASRPVVTKAADGKGKLNAEYVLGVLSSAVLHTAYRPYWNRPVSAPFSDFGSTIGNDAGMNLLHEFGPGLEQLMKNHTPKFVSHIEASLTGK
jgi:hypothetical protein